MNEFPRMVFKVGDQEEMHGGRFDYLIANDQDELDDLLADGWHLTTDEAKDANKPKTVEPAQSDDATTTRNEIEAEAKALGVSFDGRTTNAKLVAKIDEAKAKVTP